MARIMVGGDLVDRAWHCGVWLAMPWVRLEAERPSRVRGGRSTVEVARPRGGSYETHGPCICCIQPARRRTSAAGNRACWPYIWEHQSRLHGGGDRPQA